MSLIEERAVAGERPHIPRGVPGDRRRPTAGPRLSWASDQPFVRAGVRPEPMRASGRRWRDVAARYQAVAVVRDLVLCMAAQGLLLAVLHGPSRLQLLWGMSVGAAFVAMVAVERGYVRANLGDGPGEFEAIIRGGVLTAAGIALLGVGLHVEMPRILVFGGLPAMVVLLVAVHHASRKRLHRRRDVGDAMERTLVVGGSAAVDRVIGDLRAAPYHGYLITGTCVPSLLEPAPREDVPVLGTLSDIPQVVVDHGYDVVVVAGAELSGDALRRLSWALQRTPARLVVVPGLVEVFGPRVSLEPTAGLSLINVRRADEAGGHAATKRLFDVAVASLALVVLTPALLAIGAAVRLTSRGPALFRQVRVGQDGREFSMLKFRSMVVDAELMLDAVADGNGADGPLFKHAADPRVTPFGRFLRKHSIDELPQIINVLRGDMSLVGPRPPLPREVALYEEPVRRRLLVKPGLTGLWQINGRADLPWTEAVKLDLRYVENWSIGLDLIVIWKTLRVVVSGHGGR